MSRWRTIRTRSGSVIQAGLDVQPRDYRNPMRPMLGTYRALVIATRVAKIPDPGGGPGEFIDNPETFRRFQVECDVLLIRSHSILQQVPVQQSNYGVNNANPWVPRPTTRSVSGEQSVNFDLASSRGSTIGTDEEPVIPVLDFGDADGDMVLVEFVEGMIDYPIITGALTHEQTKRFVRQGDGWSEGSTDERGAAYENEHYLVHQGTEVRINADGDVLIDTVAAHNDPVDENPATGSGQVRIRVKEGQRFTVAMGDDEDVFEVFKDGSGLHIHLGEGATESIVLGDAFKTLYDMHTHSSPAGGSTGAPAIPMNTGPSAPHLSTQHKVK